MVYKMELELKETMMIKIIYFLLLQVPIKVQLNNFEIGIYRQCNTGVMKTVNCLQSN